MAEDAHHADEPGAGNAGTMDIRDHVKTWLAFWVGVKWSVAGLLLIAIFLAIFRTHN